MSTEKLEKYLQFNDILMLLDDCDSPQDSPEAVAGEALRDYMDQIWCELSKEDLDALGRVLSHINTEKTLMQKRQWKVLKQKSDEILSLLLKDSWSVFYIHQLDEYCLVFCNKIKS